jgi:hypothetical protein
MRFTLLGLTTILAGSMTLLILLNSRFFREFGTNQGTNSANSSIEDAL